MNDFPLIDFSQPHLILKSAADFYLPLYQQILVERSKGVRAEDVRVEMPAEGKKYLPRAIQGRSGERLPRLDGETDRWTGQPETYDWTFRDGVATIDFRGPVVKRSGMLSAMSGMASTETLASQLQECMNEPLVKAVIICFDTPGGSPAGIPEVADQMMKWRDTKPIDAYVDNLCASAGLFLAVACRQIVISPIAEVGSVGAVFTVIDDSAQMKMMGLKEFRIHNTKSPKKALAASSPELKADLERRADVLSQVFADYVSKCRNVPIETVWQDFGQGSVLVGQECVDVNMVDRIGDYEMLHSELANGSVPVKSARVNGKKNPQEKNNMALKPTVTALLAQFGIHSPYEDEAKAEEAAALITPAVPVLGAPAANPALEAEVARLRAENASQKAALETREVENKATAQAALDARLIEVANRAGEAFGPAAKEAFAAKMESFKGSDEETVSNLESLFSRLPQNTARVEIDEKTGKAKSGVEVPKNTDEDDAKMSDERRAELYGASALGREVQTAK